MAPSEDGGKEISMRRKQKGALALSVILASSLSAPSIAMAADTTTLETNQIEVSAEANTAAAEQPEAPASNEQPAAAAPSEQPAASASSEQPAAAAPSEQPATPVSNLASNQQAGDHSAGNADANDLGSSAKSGVDADSSDTSTVSESAENDALSSEQSQEAENNAGEELKDQQKEAHKSFKEPPVDQKTTAPNKVDEVVRDDNKQGTDISIKANMTVPFFGNWSLADSTASIKHEDANNDKKTLGDVSVDFKNTALGDVNAGDLVVKGDMSMEEDTAKDAAHNVEKDLKYDIKSDLDVSAIHTAIEKSESMLNEKIKFLLGNDAAKSTYVNHLETGLRSTFVFGSGLNGEFYVPVSLEDAQAHYILSSADDHPLIYRINYANSKFAKEKVIIIMDLDLTHVNEQKNSYGTPKNGHKELYGEKGVMENFNHKDDEYDPPSGNSTYDTSTFGNFKQLITSSAQKISLLLKDVMFHSATGNRATTENDTETRTTTEGSIEGTLVGYMKADVGHSHVKGNVSYVWGAMQEADGKDVNATGDHENHVMLSVSFTETTPKNIPSTPDSPSTPDTPSTLDTPTTPEKPSTPSVKKPSTTHKKVTQTTNVVTESKMPESPATGDTSNLYLWFLSMIASFGVCVTGMIHLGKKKSSRFHD